MYTLSTGEFPLDTFITFNGDEFFELQSPPAIKNCIALRFVFNAPGDAILVSYSDGTDGFSLEFETYVLKLKVLDGGSEYVLTSNALSLYEYHFVEMLLNINSGDSLIYVNGVDQKASNTVTGISSIANDESLKIGGTNIIGTNTGVNTIGMFSFSTIENWFTTDISDFESEYNSYILNKYNDNFPYGGPNVYQMIDESKQSYLQTPPGTVNIPNAITLDNYEASPIVSFDPKNYVDDDTAVNGFEIARISGTDPVYEYLSEFQGDESALLNSVTYLDKTDGFTGSYGDIVIEAIFKCDGTTGYSYIFGYGDYSTGQRMYLRAKSSSTMSLEFVIVDSAANSETYSLPSGNINTNTWNHVFIVINRGGSLSSYVNGSRIETKSISQTPGTIYDVASDFFIGAMDTQYNDDPIYISKLNIWEKYEWLSSSAYDTFVSQRYSDYQNGGIDYHAPIPISVYTFGDDLGTYPIVMTLDKDGIWQLQYVGETKSDKLFGEFTVEDGIYGIRLFSKFEENGYSNFDDVQSGFVNIERIQISKKYKRVFERIILQTKPLSTWAILMIEWV
jgi:hypothetical protein